MADTGVDAAMTLTFAGATASNLGQEVDLAVDPAGDGLVIEPGGDVLIATPKVLWTGTTAAEIV